MRLPYWIVLGFETPDHATLDLLTIMKRRYDEGCDLAMAGFAVPDLKGALEAFVNAEVTLGND